MEYAGLLGMLIFAASAVVFTLLGFRLGKQSLDPQSDKDADDKSIEILLKTEIHQGISPLVEDVQDLRSLRVDVRQLVRSLREQPKVVQVATPPALPEASPVAEPQRAPDRGEKPDVRVTKVKPDARATVGKKDVRVTRVKDDNKDTLTRDKRLTVGDSPAEDDPFRKALESMVSHTSRLEAMIQPLSRRSRLQEALNSIAKSGAGRGLDELLNSAVLHGRGHIQGLVLSDESGLPLAASSSCRNTEALAAVSSLIFNLVSRVRRHGLINPNAVVFETDAGAVIHRLLEADGRQFIVTILVDDPQITADVFDSLILKTTRLLLRED